jgi:hypothetical protein
MADNTPAQSGVSKDGEVSSFPSPSNPIEEAKATVKMLQEENIKLQEALKKLEALKAEDILSGKTTAGQIKEKPQKLSSVEYAKSVIKGIIPKE